MVTTGTGTREVVTQTKKGIGLETARPRGNGRGGRGPNGRGPGGGGPSGGDGPGGRQQDDWSPHRYRIGIFVGIASILMMFTALASAYIVRAGLPGSIDWRPIPVPSFIWLSTALMLASSVSMVLAQRRLRSGAESAFKRWLTATLLLGLGFLVSQLVAWRQLVRQGLYLASNPHSSFFYVLTGLHGLHLLGGILGLGYLCYFFSRERSEAHAVLKQRTLADVVALYWHFMDALWLFLFVLLFLWR